MIDQYKREVNKLKIELSSYANLSLDELQFIIGNMVQIGIKSVELDLKNTIDYNYLIKILDFISNECKLDDICVVSECIGMKPYLSKLKSAGLNKLVICIDSLKQYKYKSIHCGANINDIINSINTALSLKIKTTLKCIVVNGFNTDEISDYISMTKSLPIDICFSEIIPANNKLEDFQESYVEIKTLLEDNSNVSTLNNIDDNRYKLLNSVGNIYVESHNYSSKCINCNEVTITENGLMKTCVHKNSAFDIKPYLYKPMIFKETIKEIIYLRQKNNIEGGAYYG